MIYHFIPTKIVTVKKQKQKTSTGNDMEKLQASYNADGDTKWYSPCGKHFDNSYHVKHSITIQPSNTVPKYVSKRVESTFSQNNL